jgi:hypothetical protein
MADPLIAIIGSVHPARAEELKLKKPAAGERAAEAIGHALASQKCRIVGYSDEGWSECRRSFWPLHQFLLRGLNPALSKQVLLSLLLIAPLLAGISGATARTAFESVGDSVSQEPSNLGRTCGLGAVAGGVAGALFIIAQLVAMSPEIDPSVWSKQAGRLVPFSALIGFIGGLTLDAVFRKLVGVNVISDEALNKLMSDRRSGGRV